MNVIAAVYLLMICSVRGFQQNPSITSTRRQILQTSNQHSSRTRQTSLFSSTQTNDSEPKNKRRSNEQYSKKKKRRRELGGKELKNPDEVITWRCYGIDVYPDDLGPSLDIDKRKEKRDGSNTPSERSYLTPPVISSLLSRLRIKSSEEATDGLPPILKDARVVRRSLDARRRKGSDPKYTYVIDIDLTRQAARNLGLTQQSGKMEIVDNKKLIGHVDDIASNLEDSKAKPRIIIVGAGPAGLFCALSLASSGMCTPILLERGQPVEGRGKSIGALIHRRNVDPESNFSFGEGGAGTWSDGKLTTRIGRNSESVRYVLETLVKYGAPERILVEGAPHLGTDNMVRLLRNMREDLRNLGGEIHFGTKASKYLIEDGKISGVEAECVEVIERTKSNPTDSEARKHESSKTFYGDAVVLATGHSARDVYEELYKSGVELEPKGFAVGFRIEHPQWLINEIQYGRDWGGRVFTKRPSTDAVNTEHFERLSEDTGKSHQGNLPVASYRLATDKAFDGKHNRGAYSFCMCPGGQIVPSSTEEGELCINGMSFSNRDSLWANSALVVTVAQDDPILDKYRSHGCLAGLEFQRDIERKAYQLGGMNMTVPVQRLTDYVNGVVSSSIPASSYRLGAVSAPLHEIYPKPLYNALSHAITEHFEKQMPGFLFEDALLHGVETRTSSPLRLVRNQTTLQAGGVENLYPAGEGAGFAGGIVSAAVDGLVVAKAVKAKFLTVDGGDGDAFKSSKSIGFDY
ncbi:hypothetical protein ACHAWT_004808 [Skeletonema menzelii]